MDGEKFDDLIKRLFTIRLTRGNTLRGLAAGAAAALTGATLAEDETDAKGKSKHHQSGHAAHKDGGGGGHKGHGGQGGDNKNKHHKDNHQADAAGKHGKKKKKNKGKQPSQIGAQATCVSDSKVSVCHAGGTNS